MLTTSTNTSFVPTYDRSGRTGSLLRSEPAQPVAAVTDQGSTTAEKYKDKVTLSADGLEKWRHEEATGTGDTPATEEIDSGSREQTDGQQPSGTLALSTAEQKMVQQLQQRDREVKTHEMAHLASAGQYARGGPTYSYQQGPDGRRYAVGGEVPIDISKEKTPEQTIQKMQAVKRAALAPAEPSSADRSIAAAATAMESQARQELHNEQARPAPQTTSGNADTHSEKSRGTDETPSAASRQRLTRGIFA